MTIAELNSRFDLICDRVGSPYFEITEKNNFFNTAQKSIIEEILFPKKKVLAQDLDITDYSKEDAYSQGIAGLIRVISIPVSGATGTASIVTGASQINFGPSGTLGTLENFLSGRKVYRVLNFYVPDTLATGVTSYNAATRMKTLYGGLSVYGKLRTFNAFLTEGRTAVYAINGTAGTPSGTNSINRIEFFPPVASGSTGSYYAVEVIASPELINITNNIGPSIDESFHNELLFRSLQLAGVSSRDSELAAAAEQQQQQQQVANA